MLALICGSGTLPAQLAQAQADMPLVCAMEGHQPEGLEPDLTFRLETLGSLLRALEARGMSEVCFCGAIERPVLDPDKLDSHTAPLVPVITKALSAGDDGALRAVIEVFESKGFHIRGADELLPGLRAPAGVLSQRHPDAQMQADAQLGRDVLRALAPMDVGQACVTGGGQLIGVETIGGTDFMLAHLPETPLRGSAILVKGPKRGQDMRVDMPTIGPQTIKNAIDSGLAGIVIEAGCVLLLHPETCIAMADAAGLVLWSRERS